jgi:aldose 1-epimerase
MASSYRQSFGVAASGRAVDSIFLENGGFRAEFLTQGAILRSWSWPVAGGGLVDVVLGCASLADYEIDTSYHGAVVGRYANRIAAGRFSLDGKTYQVPVNNGPNHLHGGSPGFDKAIWEAECQEEAASVSFRLASPDGDQGYPGALLLEVIIRLESDGSLTYRYQARTSAPTILNPTAHAYFNLAGHDAGGFEEDHLLQIHASRYVPKDTTGIPIGGTRAVEGTPYDFRAPKPPKEPVGDAELAELKGFDHTWVVDGTAGSLRPAARMEHVQSGRALEILTSEPGIHFYNGHYNEGSPACMKGTNKPSSSRSGFALETQHFPDSPNQPDFPPVVLRPGETFQSVTVYRPVLHSRL